ncbi:hypothetical protein C3942_05560 [Solimonas fluminis]|uniref:Uncharacterized protein n=2 Tax=Solimonas fluminis TaxID=2086571 RepID=A0A2S5TJI7_9GAMM|nr:hypothetical protein C3942_05560 [Solimonas fluminis]
MSELATDLAAVFMGFGIFQANSAFSFHQFTEGTTVGWRSSSRGYLSAPSLLFALAIFVVLTDADPKVAERHLNADLVGRYRRALKHAHSFFERIQAMKSL